ncbi:hypothetical protein BDK63_001487 [Halomonas campaniensis]|uniref:GspL cytoplasmic actin-ATPase-like domain-containing protein n=1 Tax=Halomonas campaniensis TaxID=213554 RepID=A0A7W5PAC5_9GAMM|nr:type II secretion system protein GspL [Halomonas campaniensis]MBB3330619.1 hypothetical protein [Halomonas campaniensis]
MNFRFRLPGPSARRPPPRLILRCRTRTPPGEADHARLDWAVVDVTLPDREGVLESGTLGGPEESMAVDRVAALSRLHATVLLLHPEAVSHFHPAAPRGIREREWPLLIEEQVAGEVADLELAALNRSAGHLELIAVERRRLREWQAWLEARGVTVTHWASEFMGLPDPPAPETLSVLGDTDHWMIKALPGEAAEPASVEWLLWPREWEALLPPGLRERTRQVPAGLAEDAVPSPAARLSLYARHLPTRLPALPGHRASPLRVTGGSGVALALLLAAHLGLSAWPWLAGTLHAGEPRQAAGQMTGETFRERNQRLREILAGMEETLMGQGAEVVRYAVEGQHLSITWQLPEGTRDAAPFASLGSSAEVVWHRESGRLSIDIDLQAWQGNGGGQA